MQQIAKGPFRGARSAAPGVDRIGRLHRGVLDIRSEVRALLGELVGGPPLTFTGLDDRAEIGAATLLWVSRDRAGLRAPGLRFDHQPQVYFQFEHEGCRYFFAARPLSGSDAELLEVDLPAAIYTSERRLSHRWTSTGALGAPRRVELEVNGAAVTAQVRDWSDQGLGVAVPSSEAGRLRFPSRVRYLDGDRSGAVAYASLQNRRSELDSGPWVRLGLTVSEIPFGPEVPIERRRQILVRPPAGWKSLPLASSRPTAEARSADPLGAADGRVEILEYANEQGQPIRAIVNKTGDVRGATAVVIPPAWGRTKERTLPLAATLIETFEQAGEPLAVVRFDGTNRSGESYVPPSHRAPGDEYLGFTFSQAARDIQATFDFLERDEAFSASRIVLVTFSLGAVEGRRGMAVHHSDRLAGWVSVVGMADLQAGLRTVSGGIDYGHGLQRGVHFGVQELVGVVADMDRTGLDAIENRLMFFEDARRDMAAIEAPVCWIHGRDDAWMDLERVQQMLSSGETSNRRLVEIPCGHQMRSSREALETFQLIAGEVSTMALGRALTPVSPNLRSFVRMERAERDRLKIDDPDLRTFWRDYLLGDDESVGIELMTATRAYGEFMALQLRELEVGPDDRIVDLGAGVGDFSVHLAQAAPSGSTHEVIAVDLVPGALRRGAARLEKQGSRPGVSRDRGPTVHALAADLDLGADGGSIPLRESSVDRVIASLLLSYLSSPSRVLRDAVRILRPGGRLVLSTLRRDADISKLYVDGIAELLPDRMREHFGLLPPEQIERLQQRFLNNASRLLTLEDAGNFRFWDEEEICELVRSAGFREIRSHRSFGHPPQAIVVSAVAP